MELYVRIGGGNVWQTVKDFVIEWNQTHKRFVYALFYGHGAIRPTSVEVRYSAAKYRNFLYKADTWKTLTETVERISRGTMFAVTDEWLFERGVLEFKIASYNHNYQDKHVISVLKWLGEDFFGDLD